MDFIQIIAATPEDIPRLLLFMEQFYEIDDYPFDKEQTSRSLNEFIADPARGFIWMIYERDLPIGYIILAIIYSFEFGGRNAFVDEFFLNKENRGKGIGKIVMDAVSKEAERLNIQALHLEVEHHNVNAVELYRKYEFKDHHRLLMTRMTNTKKLFQRGDNQPPL